MKIKEPQTLKQALANMKLEGLTLSPKVNAILQQALKEKDINTETIMKLLRETHNKD